ncbi:CinA family protein [Protaetiibacter mangrovi]|uniref:CinA family protein n=1 Tax=Protaetiibacter mangrovi TaxID=2970926 RepID=A0ABT1ZF71_9MICO|nr:CinA family protein [Protaetiibacter mangrovi]MCS0499316.1 CinA family protein [Protaetiibacter mangrovi]TPX02977.1 CinA family protein [Schumannella luteola]
MTARSLAERIVGELTRRGERVALAESLTGGLLTSALVDVPGASLAVSGGVVAYATPLKAQLLGVDAGLLAERGPIDAEVARQMAAGVRERLALDGRAADWGLATTGVAGPDPQDGFAPGTLWVGIADAAGASAREFRLAGGRADIRAGAVAAALGLLAERLDVARE